VAAYLKSGVDLPKASCWNSTGRAIPDVSALSTNYQTLSQNFTGSATGTSAAAPVFAALVALVNQRRAEAGKAPLGFLNPALYTLQGVGRDVVDGENKSWPCSHGFKAAPGWDAITGLGSPILSTLMKLG